MAKQTLHQWLNRTHEGNIQRPKAMPGQAREKLQHMNGLADVGWVRQESRIGNNPYEAGFGHRASGPVVRTNTFKPFSCSSMADVILAHQCNEKVNVQEKACAHRSSASKALTRSDVIGSRSFGKSNTGRPSTNLMRAALRVLRNISSAIALLRLKSRLLAYCAATSAISSSRVIVVRIRKLCAIVQSDASTSAFTDSLRLLHRCRSRGSALPVVLTGVAGGADRTDNLPIGDQQDAAFHWNSALNP